MNEVHQKVLLIIFGVFLCTISACAPTTTYVSVQYPDKVYEGGKFLYAVNPGDELEVMYTKTCPDGRNECWAVRNVKTNEIGYVLAQHMKGMHTVYKAPKSRETVPTPPPITDTTAQKSTYVSIQYPDKVYEGGKFKYAVNPGDELELMYTKTCLNGRGECWVVRNVKTDEIGVVAAERIKGLHKVYKAPARKNLLTASAPVSVGEKGSDTRINQLHKKLKQLNSASDSYREDNLYLYEELLKLEPKNSVYKYYVNKYKREIKSKANKEQEKKILNELLALPEDDYQKRYILYGRLINLAPQNAEYKNKYEYYKERLNDGARVAFSEEQSHTNRLSFDQHGFEIDSPPDEWVMQKPISGTGMIAAWENGKLGSRLTISANPTPESISLATWSKILIKSMKVMLEEQFQVECTINILNEEEVKYVENKFYKTIFTITSPQNPDSSVYASYYLFNCNDQIIIFALGCDSEDNHRKAVHITENLLSSLKLIVDLTPSQQSNISLIDAASSGNFKKVKELLDSGTNVNFKNSLGNSALIYASGRGYSEIVELLIAKGAEVNAQGQDGMTPLYMACSQGHIQIVKLLLANEAIVNIKESRGYSPLLLALIKEKLEVAEILIDAGADVNASTGYGYTPLLCASLHGYNSIVQYLIDKGADVNAREIFVNHTPLMYAAGAGQTDIVSILIKAGAELDAKDRNGCTAQMIASFNKQSDTVQILLDAGATKYKSDRYCELTYDGEQKDVEEGKTRMEAYSYLVKGEYEKAINTINEDISNKPPANAYFIRGTAYLHLNQLDQAVKDLNKILELDPQHDKAYHNRGEVYSRMGRNEEALSDLNRAIEINPRLGVAYASRGIVNANLGNYDQAVSDMSKGIELNPEYDMAYNNRAALYMEKGRYKEASVDLEKAIELNPRNHFAYLNRGEIFSKQEKLDQAIAEYSKAINIEKNFAKAYDKLALIYFKKGMYDNVIENYTTLIELEPQNYMAFNRRGYTYIRTGQHDLAIADLNDAIKINPKLEFAYYNLGNIYAKMSDYQRAIYYYTRTIEIKPSDIFYADRGHTYRKMAEYEKAILDYDMALEINSSSAQALNNKAWILATCPIAQYRNGAEAVKLATKAVKIAPTPINSDTLAAAYAENGNFEDAIETQEEVIQQLIEKKFPPEAIDDCKERLTSYKNHIPWSEEAEVK